MNILQADSRLVFPKVYGKWSCSDSVTGPDGDSVHRYLHPDGTWRKFTHWFDTREQITETLKSAKEPDFSLSRQELADRAMIRHDMQQGFDEIYDDRFDDRHDTANDYGY